MPQINHFGHENPSFKFGLGALVPLFVYKVVDCPHLDRMVFVWRQFRIVDGR